MPTKPFTREEVEFAALCEKFGEDRHLLTPLVGQERIRIWISLADGKKITMAGRQS